MDVRAGTMPAARREAKRAETLRISLWPKEHGAYGQIAFPLLAAFLVAGVTPAGLLIALTVAAAFLAHEPAVILLGLRGERARRDMQRRASRWLIACTLVGTAAGTLAMLIADAAVRRAAALPAAVAFFLAITTIRGREKSWYGEIAAVLAFSGAAVPVCLAAGAPPATAAFVAVPFALLFTASTLAVRGVIMRVRGGGNPRAARTSRASAVALAVCGTVVLALLSTGGVLPWAVLAASVPGLLTAAAIAAKPPAPAHLRTIGWTLMAVSVLTLAIVAGGG